MKMSMTLVKTYVLNIIGLLLINGYLKRDGDLRIIRPFVYVREKDLRAFAEQNHLPIIAENCPACFEAPKVNLSINLVNLFK